MEIFGDVDFKALIFGAAIASTFVIFGYMYWDWFYPFAAMGLLYAGYAQKNVKYATVIGAIASTPLIILAFQTSNDGYFGKFEGFFATETGVMVVVITIILVGAFIGFVGRWAKRNRIKAQEEYAKQQKIGKNKNKKKNAKETPKNEKKGFLSKISKK